MALVAFPTVATSALRRRSVGNLLRMGHCAPTVMQTVVDASDTEAEWPVRLTAGLPGGIGNTRGECGGLTAPLLAIGLVHGRDKAADGLPVAVEKGHDLLQRFTAAHGTTECRDILGDARLPLRCVGVVRQAPAMCAQCLATTAADALPPATREAHRELYAHWQERGFHCADAVFSELEETLAAPPELRDATTAFMGGTLFRGMTCSALAAGVMALGLARGQIEDSRPRVLRMLATMAAGGDASADHLNAFNPVMNLGHELAKWFQGEFGSTQCRVLTGCDFASTTDVREYIAKDGTGRCARMAERVAARVAELVERLPVGETTSAPAETRARNLRAAVGRVTIRRRTLATGPASWLRCVRSRRSTVDASSLDRSKIVDIFRNVDMRSVCDADAVHEDERGGGHVL